MPNTYATFTATGIVDRVADIPFDPAAVLIDRDIPLARLYRAADGTLGDMADLSAFYIDPIGRKHPLPPVNAVWPLVSALLDDKLIADNGSWRIETDDDRLDALKDKLAAAIDARAEELRLLMLTPGSGQMMEYQEVAAEAARFALDENPTPGNYPMIAAAIPTSGASLAEVVETVNAQRDAMIAFGAAIRKARLNAKAAVQAAGTALEARAAAAAVTWPALPQ